MRLLCRSSSHYRADFSSTGLLRDNTVYLNIKNGGGLIAAVDAAHTFTAAGYSTTGAMATDKFAKAVAELQRYLVLVQTAQSDGRLTETEGECVVVANGEHHRRSDPVSALPAALARLRATRPEDNLNGSG